MRIERAVLALGVLIAASLHAGASQDAVDTLAEVQRAADSGEFARAMALVRAEPDPRIALRAEVWLTYRARDFEAAYAACQRALDLEPSDLWLAERSTAAALWMRDPARAMSSLQRLEKNAAAAEPASREAFVELLAQDRQAASELDANARHARAARSRARICSLAVLGAVLCAMSLVGLGLRKSSAP